MSPASSAATDSAAYFVIDSAAYFVITIVRLPE